MNIVKEGKEVFLTEIAYLSEVMDALDEKFVDVVNCINECSGKLILTGVGKPGHVARKIAATMSSLGTPSFFLHPVEALHGDLGMVKQNDVVLVISSSGESSEIIKILPNLKLIGAKIIALTSNQNSTLARYSDVSYILPKAREACNLNLAPTSSTTAILVWGDALAIVLSMIYGFTKEHFGLYHPEGTLGRELLLKVSDIMRKGTQNPTVLIKSKLTEVISIMCRVPLGIISVVDDQNHLRGVFSDGDIRRLLENNSDIYSCVIDDVMIKTPHTVGEDLLAVEAIKLMESTDKYAMPVLDGNGKVTGTLLHRDIKKAGIMG